jgi:hypothetical protein
LKINTFVATSETTLLTQNWPVLIAMLQIKYLGFSSKLACSVPDLVVFFRWNLFAYRDIHERTQDPSEVQPVLPRPVQHALSSSGPGQHLHRGTRQTANAALPTTNSLKRQRPKGDSSRILVGNDRNYRLIFSRTSLNISERICSY